MYNITLSTRRLYTEKLQSCVCTHNYLTIPLGYTLVGCVERTGCSSDRARVASRNRAYMVGAGQWSIRSSTGNREENYMDRHLVGHWKEKH